jgi:hypothetical protein
MSVLANHVIEVPDLSAVERVSDLALEGLLEQYAVAARQVAAGTAIIAGEVARRSARELGYSGLSQRTGDRTPEAFVARVTRVAGSEARDLVNVGRVIDTAAPWFVDVVDGVNSGDLTVGAAAAITNGLGSPGATVSADDLLDAAKTLVVEAATLPPEKVARRARELRDELDAAGVIDREAALREKRSFRWGRRADGMTPFFGLLDPESSALVIGAIELVISPRRGGPRFVDSEEAARARAIVDDPRSTEQIALDALVDMVRIAGAADQGRVFGVRKPGVRVVVDARDLASGEGVAHIEGQTESVSVQTAERIACTTGYLPIVFRSGGPIDVGVAQRLFTERQRVALAVIWGGCAVETCERPPSWTEAHHIKPWEAGGPTDIDNGILLCRHHHMLVHNNNWCIRRDRVVDRDEWRMHPPGGDSIVRALRLIPKSQAAPRTAASTAAGTAASTAAGTAASNASIRS